MASSLDADATFEINSRLAEAARHLDTRYPGESGKRQPVHVVYGGAQLFKAETAGKLGELARRAQAQYAPDAASLAAITGLGAEHPLAQPIFERVLDKLRSEAVEDFRIDFEDGYGNRSDSEEDGHAEQAALEVARGHQAGLLPPFIGIRIKPFTEELRNRSIRTLDIFVSTLSGALGGKLPRGFVVTLPKVMVPEQMAGLADLFELLEQNLELTPGTLRCEAMIETTQAIIGEDGSCQILPIVQAARGRCIAAHFGTYDYTASCSITAAHQHMRHAVCDFAKQAMQVALAGSGVWISDGATNIMPVGPHRASPGSELTAEQVAENDAVVRRAWRVHYDDARHSLVNGIYQGWDLHPAQLVTRYAAVYTFFLEGLDPAAERLRNFVEKAAQATLVGDVFDDAATGQGLLNYFLRAINCGAIDETQALAMTSLSLDELRSRSFVRILKARRGLDLG